MYVAVSQLGHPAGDVAHQASADEDSETPVAKRTMLLRILDFFLPLFLLYDAIAFYFSFEIYQNPIFFDVPLP
jgi:hypothetical protein